MLKPSTHRFSKICSYLDQKPQLKKKNLHKILLKITRSSSQAIPYPRNIKEAGQPIKEKSTAGKKRRLGVIFLLITQVKMPPRRRQHPGGWRPRCACNQLMQRPWKWE